MARPTKELSALYAVAATINRSLDLEEILYLTLDKILKTLKVDAGTIRLLDEERQRLVLQASRGIAGDLFGDRREISMGEGFSGQVAASGEPLLIEDTESYP
ncbi:MAG: GAF domain-containing protein, partial [Nitrospirae bacterium]|nr:GAF domain-containing protein [Nitrospirota bacterium]